MIDDNLKNGLMFLMIIMFILLVVGIVFTNRLSYKYGSNHFPLFTEYVNSNTLAVSTSQITTLHTTSATTSRTTTVSTSASTSVTSTSTSTSASTTATTSTICQGKVCAYSVNVIANYTQYIPVVLGTNTLSATTQWGACLAYSYHNHNYPEMCIGNSYSANIEYVPFGSEINYLCTADWYAPSPFVFVNWTGSINNANICNRSNLLTVRNPVTIVANYQQASTTTTTISYSRYATVSFKEKGLPANTRWSVKVSNRVFNSTTNTISATLPTGVIVYNLGYISGYSTEYTGILNLSQNTALPVYFYPCGHGEPANVFNYTKCTSSQVPVIFDYVAPLPQGDSWSMTFNTVRFTTTNKYMIVTLPAETYHNVYATKYNGTRTPPIFMNISYDTVIESGGFGGDYYVDAITPVTCANGALYPPSCTYFAAPRS